MALSPPPVVSTSEIFRSGDVTISPTAVIAPGTILRAAPDSRIVIGEGVCLGWGVILIAPAGEIVLESGVILGTGVLVVGPAQVGANACIGPNTTIFQTNLVPQSLIAAASLLGDTSRPWSFPRDEISSPPQAIPEPEPAPPVVGQVYINQLLLTLFPERQQFKPKQG